MPSHSQRRSHDFILGAQKLSAEGARIEAPKAPRGERQRIFGIFEAYRTLLVESTLLNKF